MQTFDQQIVIRMATCGVCTKAFKSNSVKVQCSDCKTEFHGNCVSMSRADIDYLSAEEMPWRCNTCASARRASLRFDADIQEGKLSLDDVMKKILEIAENQKLQEQNFNRSYELLSEKLDVSIKQVQEQKESLGKCLTVIEKLISENKQLNKKVSELEKRVEDMEQYSRSNAVEIHGIPIQPNEDVVNVVKEVGKALDMVITDNMHGGRMSSSR
jgi:protein-arginine kinase activator protein McsA